MSFWIVWIHGDSWQTLESHLEVGFSMVLLPQVWMLPGLDDGDETWRDMCQAIMMPRASDDRRGRVECRIWCFWRNCLSFHRFFLYFLIFFMLFNGAHLMRLINELASVHCSMLSQLNLEKLSSACHIGLFGLVGCWLAGCSSSLQSIKTLDIERP